MIADASGVVALPADEARQATDEAMAREKRVQRTMERLAAGEKLGEITGVVASINSQPDGESK